jgi:hypothetical protein
MFLSLLDEIGKVQICHTSRENVSFYSQVFGIVDGTP